MSKQRQKEVRALLPAPYLPVPQVVSSQTELLQLQVLSQETVPGTYTGPAAG